MTTFVKPDSRMKFAGPGSFYSNGSSINQAFR